MENILSRKRQLPHLKLMLIYIYGVKWLIFIISTGIQVGRMTSAKPLGKLPPNQPKFKKKSLLFAVLIIWNMCCLVKKVSNEI